MSNKLKIMTVVGTRPEIIRLSRVIVKLDEFIDQCLVFTGQNFSYELSDVFFKDLGLRVPDYSLGVRTNSLGCQLADLFEKGEDILLKEKPDAVLILGDTNSALFAVLAKRLRVPVFHMEAGNRSFDDDVPEEINRRIVDHISDVNMPYTEHSRRYLLREGLSPDKIYVTGSPLREVYEYYKKRIEESKVLEKLKINAGEYFLASVHREENINRPDRLSGIINSLNYLNKQYKVPVIFTTHPKTSQYLKKNKLQVGSKINFCKPFGYFDYAKLQRNAICVLSDSGTIQEESAIMGFPAVQVRVSSERPEAFDTGNVILCGTQEQSIVDAVSMVIKQFKKGEIFSVPESYQETNVSGKVLRLIVGLTSIMKERK